MPDISRLAILTLPLLLCACGPAQETGMRLANDFKDNIYNTSAKVKEWAMTPPPKPAPQPVPTSYCYRALEDILCYRQPMPGWENRLVGYQGTDAKPPPPAMMQPLPVQAFNPAALPASRAAHAKPVFTAPPAQPKEEEAQSDAAAAPADTTHEQLPNPALAPQL